MATYLRGDLLVLTDFNGDPVDPQPDTLDDREAPDGHYGVVVRKPVGDGFAEQRWFPVTPTSDEAEKIRARLAELDRITMHRAMESWAKVNGDDFVKAAVAEKETLRQTLAKL